MKTINRSLSAYNQRTNNKKQAMKRRRLRLIPFLLLMLVSIMGTTFYPTQDTEVITINEAYTVAHGDTLWSIASSYAGENNDLRRIVDNIIDHNHLDSAEDIRPGDKLQISIEKNILNEKIR